MVQAALAAIPGLLGNQTRRTTDRPMMPQSAAAVAQAKDRKQARLIAKQAKDDRLMYLLSQPEVIGLVITLAGIYAANNIPFSDNELTNEALQASATMASVLIGLGYAGVGDLTTSIVAGLAGIMSWSGSGGSDLGSDWYKYLFPWGGLWATLT